MGTRSRSILTCIFAAIVAVGCDSSTNPSVTATAPTDIGSSQVASVAVLPGGASLGVGQSIQLVASSRDGSGRAVGGQAITWSSSDTSIASVTSGGLLSARRLGAVVISATGGLYTGSATITVAAEAVAAVTVSLSALDLLVGDTVRLNSTARDSSGRALSDRPITWSSSNTAVATVSSTGVVTGRSNGSVTLTASNGNFSATVHATITRIPAASLQLSASTVNLQVFDTLRLTAQVRDAAGALLTDRQVTWTTDNAAIATVSSAGLVAGLGLGSATITAHADGIAASASVNVGSSSDPMPVITPDGFSPTIGDSVQLTASLVDATGHVVPIGNGVWSVSDTSVARVSQSGVVIALHSGLTNINFSTLGKKALAWMRVLTARVFRVTVLPDNPTVMAGAMVQMAASAYADDQGIIVGRAVHWSTSSSNVAMITQSGVLTAVGSGPVAVIATIDGVVGTTLLTVAAAPVASVTVAPTSASITVGTSTRVVALTRDGAGSTLTDRVVAWSTSNPNIAVVSPDGFVTAVGNGSATITAVSEGRSGSMTVNVSGGAVAPPAPPPPVSVNSVSMSPGSLTLVVGGGSPVVATPRDANGNALSGRVTTWTSSNSSVASVSSSGVVSGVAVGTATITAASEGRSGTASITVIVTPVETVTIAPSSATLVIGQSTLMTPTLRDADANTLTGRSVSWSSSNTTVATVSSSGLVTARAVGAATITASSEGRNGTAVVTVGMVPVASVSVSPSTATVPISQTSQLSATMRDASSNALSGRVVSWSSSNTSVATVSSTGLVAAVAQGNATITATSEGFNGTAAITVPAPVQAPPPDTTPMLLMPTWINVSPETVTLQAGQTQTIVVTPRDSTGHDVVRPLSYVSFDPTIATFENGVVVAHVAGTVTVLVRTPEVARTLAVTVTAVSAPPVTPPVTPPAPVVTTVSVSPGSASVTVGQTTPLQASLWDQSGAPMTGPSVSWSSSNTQVAQVSSNGIVTGVQAGSAIISATNNGHSGSSTITVNAVPPVTPPAPVVTTVSVSPGSASVTAGQSTPLQATLWDQSGVVMTGPSVSWSTSNPLVAVVSSNGTVTGVLAGSATISATSNGRSGSSTITVNAVIPVPPPAPVVTSVSVSPGNASVTVGQTTPLQASLWDAVGEYMTGPSVSWSSSNTQVAQVSSNGTVTGVQAGSAIITATSNGRSGTSTVTVNAVVPPVTPPPVTPPAGGMWINEQFNYSSTAAWRSSGMYYSTEDTPEATMSIVDDPSAPGGKALNYHFNNIGCREGGTGVAMTLPQATTEMWLEVVAKFSSNFSTNFNCAGFASEYKFLLVPVYGSANWSRWDVFAANGNWTFGDPVNQNRVSHATNLPDPFDGQWHTYRLHLKLGPDGASELTIDGQRLVSPAGVSSVLTQLNLSGWEAGFQEIRLGSTMNQGPVQVQDLRWGRVAIWRNSPGW